MLASRGFRVVHFDVNTKGGGGGVGSNNGKVSSGSNGGAKKLSNVTVVEGLRAASSVSGNNLLNGGIGLGGGGGGRSKQLPPDTRQRLEDLARANTRPVSRSVSSSAAVKTMAGSAPNLAMAAPPKRGQTILEENAARLNNNGKTASVPSVAQQSALPPTRRDRDLNLKNGGGGVGGAGDVSVVPNLTLTEQHQQQQHLPTSLSSDPSKKVRPRSFWANWWRF